MNIKHKLTCVAIIIAGGAVVLLASIGVTVDKIKVNGPIYGEIVRGKDLVADILPPPEYVIEAYLVACRALSERDPSKLSSYEVRFAGLRSVYEERHDYWSKILPPGTIRTLLLEKSYEPAIAFFNATKTDFFPALKEGDRLQCERIMTSTLSPYYEAHRKVIDEIALVSNKENIEIENRAAKTLNASRNLFIVICILFTGIVSALFFGIVRSITQQLQKVMSVALRIAERDLGIQVQVTSTDETGLLMSAMKRMTENLKQIITQIATTSTSVATASSQLHCTSVAIATGAEKVAIQAGAVAGASEEMSTTSESIAQNCLMAAEGAQRASRSASYGADVVERTVAVMGQIALRVQESSRTVEGLGERSEQIGAIIGTIEDIADQTNLLALNAAIEAARAGEQGRGFAVVADEVRALAERTTNATREIGRMINSIQHETKGAVFAMEQGVREVETGTLEAGLSGKALRDILQQINEVAGQVHQIAGAAEEQTATTREISLNMQQITMVVQQTSDSAQESATAAAQLNGNAETLQRLVQQFKL